MKTGFLGSAGPEPAPSSSDEKANLGIVSKLMVLSDGLGPRSGSGEDGRHEEAHAQDRSLFKGEAMPLSHTCLGNSCSPLKTQFSIPTL